MSRIFDALARRRWLFIWPLLIVFVVPAIWAMFAMRTYSADTLVWIDSDTSIASALKMQGADINNPQDPIEAEADALKQLLQSRSFVTAVVDKTPLRSQMKSAKARSETITYVQENTKVDVVGPNSLKITFSGETPGQAVAVVKAITTNLVDWTEKAAVRQSDSTVRLFTEQVASYSSGLEKAQAAFQDYRRDHPETKKITFKDGAIEESHSSVSREVEAEYLRLRLALDAAQDLYDSSVAELGAARVLSSLHKERYVSGLHTLDDPAMPTTFDLGPMALFDFLALVAAAIIGGLAIAVAEASDKTVRGPGDIDALDLPVLGVLRAPEGTRGQA